MNEKEFSLVNNLVMFATTTRHTTILTFHSPTTTAVGLETRHVSSPRYVFFPLF